jgi:two-component system, sensor histidine kinase and response regulator
MSRGTSQGISQVISIDDDHEIVEMLQTWFELEGYSIRAFSDGAEAIQHALTNPPELIVCDLMMPAMNGFDILEELRKYPQTASIPFIFLTGESDRRSMRRGMELGADDYLTKPFTREELFSAVQSRLKRQKALMQTAQQQFDEMKTRLARTISHELKTPLINFSLVKQIIDRQVDRMAAGGTNADSLRELLESLGTGTDRLAHLTEQLSYIAQIDAGALSEQVIIELGTEVQVWSVALGGIELGRRFAFRNKLHPVTNAVPSNTYWVLGHLPALKHALAEIIANALNYTEPDVPVQLSAYVHGEHVVIDVTDSGKGMSQQEQDRALRPFEQVERDRHEQQGFGLGLPIAKRIAELHGGGLAIYSAPGMGTQVTLYLPLLVRPESPEMTTG